MGFGGIREGEGPFQVQHFQLPDDNDGSLLPHISLFLATGARPFRFFIHYVSKVKLSLF